MISQKVQKHVIRFNIYRATCLLLNNLSENV